MGLQNAAFEHTNFATTYQIFFTNDFLFHNGMTLNFSAYFSNIVQNANTVFR